MNQVEIDAIAKAIEERAEAKNSGKSIEQVQQEQADEATLKSLGSLFDMELDQPTPEEAFE